MQKLLSGKSYHNDTTRRKTRQQFNHRKYGHWSRSCKLGHSSRCERRWDSAKFLQRYFLTYDSVSTVSHIATCQNGIGIDICVIIFIKIGLSLLKSLSKSTAHAERPAETRCRIVYWHVVRYLRPVTGAPWWQYYKNLYDNRSIWMYNALKSKFFFLNILLNICALFRKTV